MALSLTARAKNLFNRTSLDIQLIVEIDGINLKFGAVPVTTSPKIGAPGLKIGDFIIGGIVQDPNSRDYVGMDGTTNSISQQLKQEEGSATSISRFQVRLIDRNDEVTAALRPGNLVDDVLYRDATVYITPQNADHPVDSLKIFSGVIDNIEADAGSWMITISHPENLKRVDVFLETKSKLNGSIDSSTTTIDMISTVGLHAPSDALRSFIKVDSEVIEFAGISGNQLTGCTRGALGTTPAEHDDGDGTVSMYALTGTALDLARKLMLSGGEAYFAEALHAVRFVNVTSTLSVSNAVFFNFIDLKDVYNVQIGDLVTITGADKAANNVTDAAIEDIVKISTGTYLVLSGVTLEAELGSSAVAKIKSQWNTLPEGCGMRPVHVDLDEFFRIDDVFGDPLPDYFLLVKKTKKAKDLINKEILFPSRLYAIPRKARVSVGTMAPPIAQFGTVILNESNILNPEDVVVAREGDQYFYNAVSYKFSQNVLNDEFASEITRNSPESLARIKTKAKVLEIEAPGIEDNPVSRTFVEASIKRLLDRFRFGAELIPGIELHYSTGITIEVGDTVIMDGRNLLMADTKKGSRKFGPRVMEVVNARKNITNGPISVDLLDTSYSIDGRYGVISPSSWLTGASTATEIVITPSFGKTLLQDELDKWRPFVGEKILVHNEDWSVQEEAVLEAIDETRPGVLILETALGFTPNATHLIDIPNYPDSADPDENALYKSVFVFFTPQVAVTSGTSGTQFSVGAGDVDKFTVGCVVEVHSADYSVVSEETKVSDITGTTITVEADLGFTPSSGQLVDFIGFKDGGLPYRLI